MAFINCRPFQPEPFACASVLTSGLRKASEHEGGLGAWCAATSRPHLGPQEGLGPQEALGVAVTRDAARPVMGEEHVQRRSLPQLPQLVHLQLADVVRAANAVHLVRRPLIVPLQMSFCFLSPSLNI